MVEDENNLTKVANLIREATDKISDGKVRKILTPKKVGKITQQEARDAVKAVSGVKFDAGKPRMELLPMDALIGVAEVLTFGAKKYSDRNWEQGMDWGRFQGALLRHMAAFSQGEDNDPETGLPHLDHAACCILMLSAYQKRNVGKDSRYVKKILDK